MKIRVKTKADIDKKHPELCGWTCPHISLVHQTAGGACYLYHKVLNWVTLPGGKEMLKRCRQCLANVIRG